MENITFLCSTTIQLHAILETMQMKKPELLAATKNRFSCTTTETQSASVEAESEDLAIKESLPQLRKELAASSKKKPHSHILHAGNLAKANVIKVKNKAFE